MADQPYGAPPAPPVRPTPPAVERAYGLMLVRSALSLVGVLATFTLRDELRRTIIKDNPAFDRHKVDQALAVGLGVAVVFGLVFLVLYVLLARQVRKGTGWARIVTFVLAGLGILSALAGLAGDGPGVTKLLNLVGLGLDVGIVVLLTRRESSEYFTPPPAYPPPPPA